MNDHTLYQKGVPGHGLAEGFQSAFDPVAASVSESRFRGKEPDPGRPAARETFGALCPSCGGSLRVSEGVKSLECEYCGAGLYVSDPRGVRSFYLKPEITGGKARLTAIRHISKESGDLVKAKHTSIMEEKLVYVPFWKMRGRFMGWICGDRVELKKIEKPVATPNGEMTTTTVREVKHPFSKFITRRVDWSAPACVLRYLGLQGIALRASLLEWEVFNHDLKASMNIAIPMTGEKKAEADCLKHSINLAKPSGSRIHAGRFNLFGKSLSLYYYPVYLIRYKFRDIIHVITIDGSSGAVIRSDVPKRKTINPAPFFFVPAALAFLAGTWFPLVIIAAALVYTADQVKSGGVIAPHRWLKHRLSRWFEGS